MSLGDTSDEEVNYSNGVQ